MEIAKTGQVPTGTDPVANEKIAAVWKDMEERVRRLARLSQGKEYDPNLQHADVMANLNAVQTPKKGKLSSKVKEIFNDSLTVIAKVGGMVADAASQMFAPAGQCYNALNFVITAWQSYLSVFDTLSTLLAECTQFLTRLESYVKGKMNASLSEIACKVLRHFVDICDLALAIRSSRAFKAKTFLQIGFLSKDKFQGSLDTMRWLVREEELESAAQTYAFASEAAQSASQAVVMLSDQQAERMERNQTRSERDTVLRILDFNKSADTWDGTAQAPISTWSTTYGRIRQDSVPGTGDWLCKHPSVKAWADREGDSPILAIVGGEASGKSYLASAIISHLRAPGSGEEANSRHLVAFYFLDKQKANAGINDLGKSVIWQFAVSDASYMQSAAWMCEQTGHIDPTEVLPKLLLENEQLKDIDATFYIVINKLGNSKGEVHWAVVKFLQNALRSKNRTVRILFTATQATVEKLKRENVSCATISIDGNNNDDITKYIDSWMNKIDFLADTNKDQVTGLRREVQERLKEQTKGNYYMIDKTLTRISTLEYAKEIYSVLDKAGRSLEDHIGDDIDKLNETRTEQELDEINEILLWIMYAPERMSVEKMTAVLHFKNDGASLRPLAERLKTKFLLFEVDNDGYVDFRSEQIPRFIEERGSIVREQAQKQAVNSSEVDVVQHFLKTVCPPVLMQKLELDKYLNEKAQNRKKGIYREDENTSHFHLARTCLHALANKAGDKLTVLRGYAARQLVYHISSVNLARIDPAPKIQVGLDLVRLLRLAGPIDNALWATKAVPTFPAWLLEENEVGEICKWMRDPTITDAIQDPEAKTWFEKTLADERNQFRLLISPCVNRMAEHCFQLESSVDATMSAFSSMLQFLSKVGTFPAKNFLPNAPSLSQIEQVEEWCQSELAVKKPSSVWHTQMAIVLEKFSQRDQAEARCRQALSSDPKNWRAEFLLGKIVVSNRQGIDILSKLIKRFKDDSNWKKNNKRSLAEMGFSLGTRYWDEQSFEKANRAYVKSIHNDPTDYLSMLKVLVRYASSKRWDDIVRFVDELGSIDNKSHLTNMAIELASYSWDFGELIERTTVHTKRYDFFDQVYRDAIQISTNRKLYNSTYHLRRCHAGTLAIRPDPPIEEIRIMLEAAVQEDLPLTTIDQSMAFFLVGNHLGKIYLQKAREADKAGDENAADAFLRKMSVIVPEEVSEDQMLLPLRLFAARFYSAKGEAKLARKMARSTLQIAIELLMDDETSNDQMAYAKILFGANALGQETDAKAALALMALTFPDKFDIRCQCGCDHKWTTPGDTWWCKDCIGVSLTPRCKEKVERGDFFNNVCHKDHDRFYVPPWDKEKMDKVPKGWLPWGDEVIGIESWKRHLIKTYIVK